jgi:uncharacterized OB-fold protein
VLGGSDRQKSDMISDSDLVARFAGRGVTRDSAPHFRARFDHRLVLNRCGDCGHWHHPPKPICPVCWSSRVEPTAVAGTGTVHLVVFLHQRPSAEGVDYSTPYPVVTVELDEQPGLRFTATVAGSPNEKITIGTRVRLDWIDRAGEPVPAFRLADEAGS